MHVISSSAGTLSTRAQRWEIAASFGAMVATIAVFGAFLVVYALAIAERSSVLLYGAGVVYVALVFVLVYGGLVYQAARIGYLRRRVAHEPASARELTDMWADDCPAITTLVPSYREEPRVVRQTLLSAALQAYPNNHVVLLIDDPPDCESPSDRDALTAARALPMQINTLLSEARLEVRKACGAAHWGGRNSGPSRQSDMLAAGYDRAARCFEQLATTTHVDDHTDRLFVEVLNSQVPELREIARMLRRRPHDEAAHDWATRRLESMFATRVDAFERKRYRNLSHAPNKAMNLNSYIGLIGRRMRVEATGDGAHELHDAPVGQPADLEVPDTEFLLTLDADSLLLRDYAARLAHVMRQPQHARVAVAQTPYSAVPGAPGVLERVAGATTDMQYIVHQGFTHYGATFWVGANALLRMTALRDIATTHTERGHPVSKFVQDRTVIEDTESSVDLAERGWQLINYPERLSYSATPPDFGSLVIQRRRWANGGLIILPKCLRYLVRRRKTTTSGEGWMRIHYLTSIATSNVALIALLFFPFPAAITPVWLPLTAVPYFLLYARDLSTRGYRLGDMGRVYALNLLLVAVNLGGVIKSISQIATGRPSAFKRTPKIAERTAAPALYVLAPGVMVAYLAYAALINGAEGSWSLAGFCAANALVLLYSMHAFIGWRSGTQDILAAVPRRRRATPAPA